MVTVNAEYRNRDVQVFILIVNPREPTPHQHIFNNICITFIQHEVNVLQERPHKQSRTDLVVLKLTVWSLSILNCMGVSPMQYCLSIVMQLWRHRRDGLFSWNKSPPSRMKSTCKVDQADKEINQILQLNHPSDPHTLKCLSTRTHLIYLCTFQDLI